MIREVYERPDGRWSFRFIYANGEIPNHVYGNARDAERGADDLIAAVRSEGDGIVKRRVPYIASITPEERAEARRRLAEMNYDREATV